MMRWYAVHTYVGAEYKALGHLRRQQFTAYLPQYLRERRHARRVDRVGAPLFPSYLFVALDLERNRWCAVQSTFGVRSLVRGGDRPIPIPDRLIERIRAAEDSHGFVVMSVLLHLRKGAPVRILHGAFANFVARFDGARDDQRAVVVLLELLGRQIRLQLSPAAISTTA